MKQSNWILGIGILVAVILIGGTLLIKSESNVESNPSTVSQPISGSVSTKNIIIMPLKSVAVRLLHID